MHIENILEVKNLVTTIIKDRQKFKAVNGISFELKKGEILGIVGESGSGKSMAALSILRLFNPEDNINLKGEIIFNGKNILNLSEEEMLNIRGNNISLIFQEPLSSLNPLFTIGEQIIDVLKNNEKFNIKELHEECINLLKLVGIPSPEKKIDDYPHQMSGGMLQRVVIAMAIANKPQILIADEPTTALDVTIQAQIIELLKKLQNEMGMSIIFISHDFGVINELCKNVLVMHDGKIVEKNNIKSILQDPKHIYTQKLINSLKSIKR